ncbi:MAG TPA: hypothetical protein VD931_17860 [Baekduia sp.]|nr:hypothetical protein [Baekduia sp.]
MRHRLSAALLAALAAAACAVPTASASTTQESTFQDDPLLVYGTPAQQYRTLDQLKQLGVDRIRVTVFWNIVAPAPESETRPAGFDAADPAAYPPTAWDRYDRLVRAANYLGIGVNFNPTAPAPLWATGDPGDRKDLADVWAPDPKEFGDFVTAVGRRYNGLVPGIPRVDYWSIWNEPNQGAWLAPQWVDVGGGSFAEASPRLYRGLVDAAQRGLEISGHGTDTILIGETAPKGLKVRGVSRAMAPRRFLLRLYCLDDFGQHLRGAAAQAQGCPTEDPATRMRAEHPGLFRISGWAHHPYELTAAPDAKPRDPEWYTTGNLRELTFLLRRVFLRHGHPLPLGAGRLFPLYLTEYGYQTDPPDPLGVAPGTQARYLNHSEWLTSRLAEVRTLAQFLMVDDKPGAGASDVERFGNSFQSGLVGLDGRRKPAYAAYRLPIHVPRTRVRRGGLLTVWGLVRPGATGRRQTVRVELRRGSRGRYRTVRTVRTEAQRGAFTVRLRLRSAGAVRFAWRDGRGRTFRSRGVAVRVR